MDSPVKQNNRVQLRIRAIRNCSNLIWKRYANIYSKLLIRFPWIILTLGLLVTIGLSICCFVLAEIQSFDQNSFVLSKGVTMKNARRIKEIFGNDTESRMHQQLNLYPGLDIIIKRKVDSNETNFNATNMLDEQVIEEVINKNEKFSVFKIFY